MSKQWSKTFNFDKDDYWETPNELFRELCKKFKVTPVLDVACTLKNGMCKDGYYKDRGMDGLSLPWKKTIWCNPPHSQTESWVRKAFVEWNKHNTTIMMILPTNTMSSNFWHEYIEGKAEYHPLEGRIRFLQDGKPSKYPSRNAYVCIIWRKK